MEIIEQSWAWEQCPPGNTLKIIENAGRSCYQSFDRQQPGSDKKFVKMLLKRGHVTPLEHVSASVRLITNRGVMAEITRHRLTSFSIESTRYVRYDGKMEFIRPVWWDKWTMDEQTTWMSAVSDAESYYLSLLAKGSRPEQAREVLPNSLKTEIVMTCNLRELRLILDLRCSSDAHEQIRALMKNILIGVHKEIPIIFDDLYEKHIGNS